MWETKQTDATSGNEPKRETKKKKKKNKTELNFGSQLVRFPDKTNDNLI